MSDMMRHKGYLGSVGYSDEDQVFHGKVEFIRDLVIYEGTSVKSLQKAFHEGTSVKSLQKAFREAVDDYLELCEREGKEAEKPFKGTFNVRTGPDLHRRAVFYAREKGANLNTVVTDALKAFLPGQDKGPSRRGKSRRTPAA
ncbi:MAG: type II toxin-antitoxin system HicB family antitoxin [bacterium]